MGSFLKLENGHNSSLFIEKLPRGSQEWLHTHSLRRLIFRAIPVSQGDMSCRLWNEMNSFLWGTKGSRYAKNSNEMCHWGSIHREHTICFSHTIFDAVAFAICASCPWTKSWSPRTWLMSSTLPTCTTQHGYLRRRCRRMAVPSWWYAIPSRGP